MQVILDTNILFKNFLLNNTQFKTFFEGCNYLGISIFLPKIVLEETIEKHGIEFQKNFRNLMQYYNQVHGLLSGKKKFEIPEEKLKEEAKKFRTYLEKVLENNSVTILNYPNIKHDVLIQKAIQKRKPFNENGKGYRDSLIWENIKSIMKPSQNLKLGSPDTVFITENYKDFCDKDYELHKDLEKELQSINLDKNDIKLYESLEIFNQESIIPNLEILEALKNELNKGNKKLNLNKVLTNFLSKEFFNIPFDSYNLGLIFDLIDIEFKELYDDLEYEVKEIRKLPSDDILLDITSSVSGRFEIFIDKRVYYGIDGNTSVVILDSNWNDYTMWGSIDLKLNMKITIITASNISTVKAIEIMDFRSDTELP